MQVSQTQESREASSQHRIIWTEEEVKQLKEVVRSSGMRWLEIAKHMPNRNPNQCAQKWKRLKGERSRTYKIWNDLEDQQLIRLVNKHGKKWVVISKQMVFRTGKQCRERYLNKLDHCLKSDPFTKEEDDQIYNNYLLYGPKWTTISKFLEGRSEGKVKNRFYTYIRKCYLQIQNPYQSYQNQDQAIPNIEVPRQYHFSLNKDEYVDTLTIHDRNNDLFEHDDFSNSIQFFLQQQQARTSIQNDDELLYIQY